jgi:NADH:ubiquinone oxidoreductase subunit 5 (subunit L)/multisubunit Na+/H+ antiporter MnhA subunit
MGWLLPTLLGLATLLPLLSFFVILCTGPKLGKRGAYVALTSIVLAGVLSFLSLAIWSAEHFPPAVDHHHHDHHDHHDHVAHADHHGESGEDEEGEHAAHGDPDGHHDDHGDEGPGPYYSGVYWVLGQFGQLQINISYYIDSLTILMFCMVTFIASCIHLYAMGYMHDEEHDVTDHEVTLSSGEHLKRPGRYYRFFQYLSLFCFSMLGLVLAGNVAMVFVFWELVGICSYFLIGFYVERRSACVAANKAFIVNRVGDFGFFLGLLALWSTLGTFSFGDYEVTDEAGSTHVQAGIFSQLRAGEDLGLQPAESMVRASARAEITEIVNRLGPEAEPEEIEAAIAAEVDGWRSKTGWWGAPYGYWLLILAGIGIFCGCVGKSAQFPLHTWLPDAMEGPTPVSALVHSATMVAAGVYLVGRFYPVFTPEVLLVIAIIGSITLFMAATIAITATDIKRVLAYSTVSQLGYMMLALGVGGWLAGMMHLVTHAFFKSLLFLCSGSVIHAVHTNEMTAMGGLRKKMPITAYTMLIGCLAIAGAGIPFVIGFSGYYSKDMILEQAFSFLQVNGPGWGVLFFVASAGGAAITAFYMFRMWYMTFAGKPRDAHRYDHAHESPAVMTTPLLILAVLAIVVAWRPVEGWLFLILAALIWLGLVGRAVMRKSSDVSSLVSRGATALVVATVAIYIWSLAPLSLEGILEQSRPLGTLPTTTGTLVSMTWPSEPLAHAYAVPITLVAFGTALTGFILATAMYGIGYLNAAEVSRQFQPVYRFLRNKWWFDELYDWTLVKPTHVVSRVIASLDRKVLDRVIDGSATLTKRFANFWEALADRTLVDGFINLLASWTYSFGVWLRVLQTGSLRQYAMFIVLATISIFLLVSFFWNPTLAG